MLARRSVQLSFASLLLLALPLGCTKTPDPSADEGATAEREDSGTPDDRPPLFNPDPSPPAPAQLVPALDGPSAGMQPGYLEGAFLFASVRAGALQEFGQSIPLEPSVARGLAELGQVLGADPRVDDVLAYLGVDPAARTSLSIRPLTEHAAAVRQTIDAAGPLFGELQTPHHQKPDAAAPPPLSADAELFLDRVESLGMHLRWHLPMRDVSGNQRLTDLMKSVQPEGWATTCASLQPTLVCTGESDAVFVVRQLPGAVQLDMLAFFEGAHDENDTELRRALVQQAVAMPAAHSIPNVGSLRGDANLLVASTPTVNLMRTAEMTELVGDLRWEGHDSLAAYQRRDDALRAFHEPERLFEGIKIEARVDAQRIHANFAWLPTPLGKQKNAEVFELLQVDADVPALAALCGGSLLCARSRGLPSTARFGSLATGIFTDPKVFETTFGQLDEEQVMLLLMLESWPNLVGMLAKFPGQAMQPPESVIAENAKKAAERVLAFGFAIRKLDTVQGRPNAEWVGFARMPEMDLSTLRGLMQLGDLGLTPVAIEGVPGSIESALVPDADVPARFYSISDPPVATGSWGWAMIADGDERVRWLAGLPRDDGAAPLAYLEIGDFWGLIGSAGEMVDEFGYAQAWLSGRSLRAQWTAGPKGPELSVLFEKKQQP